MRIAFDSRIFSAQRYGGISRYFCEIAPRIDRIPGVTLSICAPLWQSEYLSYLPSGMVHGKRFLGSPGIGKLARITSALASDPMMRLFRPDVVHETYYFPFRLGPKNAQRVLTIYDMIHERFPTSFSAKDTTSKYKAIAAKRADHVICISESTRRDAVKFLKLPHEKTSVIHLGFAMTPLSNDLQEPVVVPLKEPYLLYVGNRGGYKNFLQLLEVYAASPELHRSFKLVCFGGGVFRQDERDKIRTLGVAADKVVHFGGDDRLLASLYAHARVFVYPSLYEGFGIPPLEAMSHDLPVVCSNTSSLPEVVGDAAEYFELHDIESRRYAIERVVGHDEYRKTLIRKGRERLQRFSWDR